MGNITYAEITFTGSEWVNYIANLLIKALEDKKELINQQQNLTATLVVSDLAQTPTDFWKQYSKKIDFEMPLESLRIIERTDTCLKISFLQAGHDMLNWSIPMTWFFASQKKSNAIAKVHLKVEGYGNEDWLIENGNIIEQKQIPLSEIKGRQFEGVPDVVTIVIPESAWTEL